MSLLKDHKYMSWCISKGVKIYPEPISRTHYRIVIEYNNGKKDYSKKEYRKNPSKKDENWSKKIYELYKLIYNKNNNNESKN